jgi:hypothetical protein
MVVNCDRKPRGLQCGLTETVQAVDARSAGKTDFLSEPLTPPRGTTAPVWDAMLSAKKIETAKRKRSDIGCNDTTLLRDKKLSNRLE